LIIPFLLFFCFGFAHAGIEEDSQLSFSSNPLFMDSVFEIKIKLDDSLLHYHSSAGSAGSADVPKLIIVDDFERALLEPGEIFGYFSEIIAQSNTKVIFIGNEEKIAEKNKATGKNCHYCRTPSVVFNGYCRQGNFNEGWSKL